MVEKRFKLLLFIFIVLFTPCVFADSYDVSNIITSPTGGTQGGGHFTATELNGSTGTYTINTRYNGTITNIYYNLIKPSGLEGDCFWTNMTYTVTMEMATQDWRNRFGTVSVKPYSNYSSNWSNGRVTFVSMKKIYFTFKIPTTYTTCASYVVVNLPSNDLFTPFTGETNWNLSKITLSDTYSSGGSSGGSSGTSPTPTPTATPDIAGPIINNQNQNTQSIMTNDDENTSNIIENNNSNTQQIIESQENIDDSLNSNCKNGPNTYTLSDYVQDYGFYLKNDGTKQSNVSWGITKFFAIKGSTEYTIQLNSSGNAPSICFYRKKSFDSDSLISCTNYGNQNTLTFTTHNSANYMVLSLTPSSRAIINGPICNNWEKEQQEETNKKLDDINNSINNNNIDNGVGSNFFNDFSTTDNGGISAIVTKPLMIVDNLLSNNGQCTNLYLPEFLGVSNAYLPSGCILWNNATSTMITLWNTFVCGFASYFILKDLFKIIENLKNPDNDKVEVIDL